MNIARVSLAVLATSACLTALAAPAAAQARTFRIPAGDLRTALDAYVLQSGTEVIYRVDQLSSARTNGVNGTISSDKALQQILAGSGFESRRDRTGALAIVPAKHPPARKTTSSYQSPAPSTSQPGSALPATAGDTGEIIVTARKRDETSISVPVAITAIGGPELERRAITSMDAISRAVPQLMIGEGGGTVQGGIVAIRGISGADSNPLGDQAVSFNIDGVQIARATVRRLGELDMEQIEVLKGPQALFFGKNSPGGVVSIRTADPTDTLKAKLSAGYEFNADEFRTEGFISTPITETLGFRLAGYYSKMKGWADNIVPRDALLAPEYSRTPHQRDMGFRATLKWEPGDNFSARFKFSRSQLKGAGSGANIQFVSCPLGIPQGGTPLQECVADDRVSTGDIGPNFANLDARFGDGTSYLKQTQTLSSLELNYDLTDDLTLTSISGLYKVDLFNRNNFTGKYLEGALPAQILGSVNYINLRELGTELRLASSFDGPFNFTVGGLYQDVNGKNGGITGRNAAAPIFVTGTNVGQKGTAYSLFGQLMVDITDQLELSGGGRYSYEKKRLTKVESGQGLPSIQPIACIEADCSERTRSFKDFSPEATLTYRPSGNLTLYASYKQGFLSGGFNTGSFGLNSDLGYRPQETEGFEAGVKARLLNGALRTNLTLYSYKTNGLQVTVTTQGTVNELRNAGSVRTKGAEFDFTYNTPLDGLTMRGAIAYNRGRYLEYLASCYRGLSQPDCQLRYNPLTDSTGLLQDLSGTQLVRAPKWNGNLGLAYEAPITTGLKLGLSADTSFSSGYFADVTSAPGSWQKHYQLFDASVRVAAEDDSWEIALIGRNLTDKYFVVRTNDVPFTGTAPGNLPGTPTLLGDAGGAVNRGREVMLRATIRFGQ